jgi:uncharacterized protein YjiK
MLKVSLFTMLFGLVVLKADRTIKLNIAEPSDLCERIDGQGFVIVSDQGKIFETDSEGKVTRTSPFTGVDFEACCTFSGGYLVVQERLRKVSFLNTDLEEQYSKVIPYFGGKNKGYESIIYNDEENKIILITEKEPIHVMELNTNLEVLNDRIFDYDGDISGGVYHDGFYHLLSDENYEVLKVRPSDLAILTKQKVKVLNPEGICIKGKATLILSDNMATLNWFTLK